MTVQGVFLFMTTLPSRLFKSYYNCPVCHRRRYSAKAVKNCIENHERLRRNPGKSYVGVKK